MPSSRGGGFSGGHGGGGFSSGGGHHGGSGGRGSREPRFSTRPFSGGRRYSYINRRGRTCFFFYGGVPRRRSPASVIVSSFIFILFGLIIATIMFSALIPKKLSEDKCNPIDSYLEDTVNVLSDSERSELEETLKAIYQKTGVQPYLYILGYNDFPSSYGSINKTTLESFAYDKYVNMFIDDEGHWLVVLAVNESTDARYDDKFAWIEMAGDDTSHTITDSLFEEFQSDMQTYLRTDQLTTGAGLNRAYSNLLDNSLKLKGGELWMVVFLGIFFALFIGIPLVGMIRSVISIVKVNAYCDYRDRTGGVDESDSSEGSDLFD